MKIDEDVIVYCWPYTPHVGGEKAGLMLDKSNKWYNKNYSADWKDPVTMVTGAFVIAWLVLILIFLHVNVGSYFGLFKMLPLLLLSVYGLRRGLTHIRVNEAGIALESVAGKKILRTKFLAWTKMKRVYIVPAPAGRPLLSAKLVFELEAGSKIVPLKKIATAGEWHKLVAALQQYAGAKCSDLDAAYLDALAPANADASSYTKLWLDALSAPPRRERLVPLTAGTELQSGRFRIESKLGTGGQGSAYLAVCENGEKVVLKEYILPVYVDKPVRKQAIVAFQHEASTINALHDDHIVRMIDSFIEDQRAYLVLEYVQGWSLRQLVNSGCEVTEAQCLELASQMCAALKVLHGQRPAVVHQDFTPDNLILDGTGTLKLIDFMVAKQLLEDSSVSNTVVGKHHYMPPEQFQGKATTQSDLYALGATLYFLLTACDPEPMAPAHPILINRLVSAELDALVAKATQLDRSKRYKSVAEIESDLERLRPPGDQNFGD
jgi:tRNA A-37 threonylcarbamoyl transferase component Bud32